MTLQNPGSGADAALPDTFPNSLETLSNDAQTLSCLLDMVREIQIVKEFRLMVDLCATLAGTLSENADKVVRQAMKAERLQSEAT